MLKLQDSHLEVVQAISKDPPISLPVWTMPVYPPCQMQKGTCYCSASSDIIPSSPPHLALQVVIVHAGHGAQVFAVSVITHRQRSLLEIVGMSLNHGENLQGCPEVKSKTNIHGTGSHVIFSNLVTMSQECLPHKHASLDEREN